ncbi:DUF3093 domain-containing protein [Nocardia farcinica]|uniref:DUF3093 domain-containing protein n=1 Tax=Nocardia farcinica TaxID=37329 RepID=UPI003D78C2B2
MSDQPIPPATDSPEHAAGAAPGSTVTTYRERLWVPWWWWPIGFGVAALLAAEIQMAWAGSYGWVPYVCLFPVPVWVLLWLSRHTVRVAPDPSGVPELHVGPAHLPVSFVARAAVVAPTAKSAALGRQLDPAAYVQHRPWVGPMVLLVLDDPDDPTPYWLVSTRRPEEVLAALGVPSAE